MQHLPRALLEEHHVSLRPKLREAPWQELLRLNQALWREEQEYPPASLSDAIWGSCLDRTWAKSTKLNLMSDTARQVAIQELERGDAEGKLVGVTHVEIEHSPGRGNLASGGVS